jgi:hypothetical protein
MHIIRVRVLTPTREYSGCPEDQGSPLHLV